MVTLKAKIFNIEKKINVFVIDETNFEYDFLIGLDCIKEFQLNQDENLRISQKIQNKRNDSISKEKKIKWLKIP